MSEKTRGVVRGRVNETRKKCDEILSWSKETEFNRFIYDYSRNAVNRVELSFQDVLLEVLRDSSPQMMKLTQIPE